MQIVTWHSLSSLISFMNLITEILTICRNQLLNSLKEFRKISHVGWSLKMESFDIGYHASSSLRWMLHYCFRLWFLAFAFFFVIDYLKFYCVSLISLNMLRVWWLMTSRRNGNMISWVAFTSEINSKYLTINETLVKIVRLCHRSLNFISFF